MRGFLLPGRLLRSCQFRLPRLARMRLRCLRIVLGGIGIIPGAMVGGLLLGVVETIVSALGYSLWRDAAAFVILILILILRPAGIFGKNTREKV